MARQSKSLKFLFALLVIVVVVETGYLVWTNYSSPGQPEEEVRKVLYWRAPMDPTFISDKPGKSPMGMDLVPVYADEEQQAPSSAMEHDTKGVHEVYTCPMHPEVIQDQPGQCPKCGMDLVRKTIEEGTAKTIYTCSMHPEVIADHPGRCPQCGMELVKKTIEGDVTETVYTCPMHPEVISQEPGECPICGMDLVAKEVPKTPTVKLTSDVIQKIGVRTALVDEFPLKRTIRTVGHVTYDETRVVHITTKVGGWVEKLYVDFTGQMVRKGQPLIEIYSPELVSTQEEYLLALQSKEYLSDSRFSEVRDGAYSLLSSTRRRLLLWDITEEQIDRLEREKTVQKFMTIYSPQLGIVIDKDVFEGGFVKPDKPIYRIADLNNVWVDVSIYEYELPWVEVGQTAKMTLSYAPGKTFQGKISFIYPYLEEKTRTVKVRMEFSNPQWELKPEMYADIVIESPVTVHGLSVPDEAIIRSGDRNIVVVDRGNGIFEPRGVILGVEADNHYQVTSGLKAGDRVVTSAQFLIDSESRLKEAIQKMLAKRKAGTKEPAEPMPVGHQH